MLEPWEAATLAGDHRLALGLRPQGLPRKRARPPQPGAGKDVRTGLHLRRSSSTKAASRRCPRPSDIEPPTLDSKAPYFTAYLRQQLVERYGASKAFFGGLKVKSTLDLRLQEAAEEAVNSYLGYSPATASVVVIDNHNAGIKAMVGGPDFETKPFNLATQGHRQPGSSIKPFTLITALEEGISPETVYESAPQEFHFGKNGKETFDVTQRRGLLPRLLLDHLRDDLLRQLDLRRSSALEGLKGKTIQDRTRSIAGDDPQGGLRRTRSRPTRRWSSAASKKASPRSAGPTPTARSATTATGSAAPSPRGPATAPSPTPRSPTRTATRSRAATTTPPTTRCSTEDAAEEAKGILETVVSSGTGTNAQIGAEGQWGKTGTTENNGDAWFCGGDRRRSHRLRLGRLRRTRRRR